MAGTGLSRSSKQVRRRWFLTAFCLCLTLAACGGSDAATGPIRPAVAGDDTPSPPGPSFAQEVNQIFELHGCTAALCHGSGALSGHAGGDLTLTSSADENYANLYLVAAYGELEFLRVSPRDATNSYLVMKLEGRQLEGPRMPIGRAALSSTEIGLIRDWIDSGAPNN